MNEVGWWMQLTLLAVFINIQFRDYIQFVGCRCTTKESSYFQVELEEGNTNPKKIK